MNLWPIRITFLLLCITGGYAVSQLHPTLLEGGRQGAWVGFGMGAVLIAIDEMLKGFSLRAFSASTFGLALGALIAWLVDQSRLFEFADERQRWLIRLCLFLAFGYIGIILAMRSNKEDLALIIPYVRFNRERKPENLLILDTSILIDGRIAELVESRFLDGVLIIPRFMLGELQQLADSSDPIRRQRGRRGLDILQRLQQNQRMETRLNDTDYPAEKGVDGKLLRLTQELDAKLFTTDFNLSKIAELQNISCVNLTQLSVALKPMILAGEVLQLKLVREGRERGQAVAYLPDGGLVVVNHAQALVGQTVAVRISSIHHTGAGVMFFAELHSAASLDHPEAA